MANWGDNPFDAPRAPSELPHTPRPMNTVQVGVDKLSVFVIGFAFAALTVWGLWVAWHSGGQG